MKRILLLLFLLIPVLAIALASGASGFDLLNMDSEQARLILFEIRLPRVLMGLVAGWTLALAGLLLQALFQNPLAGPYTLGVSSGASLGAALCLALPALALIPSRLGALVGGLLAGLLVAALGSKADRRGAGGLLLAGVALSFTFSSLLLLIQVMSDAGRSLRILRWLMGGLDLASWEALLPSALLLAPVAVVLQRMAGHLDLLSLGEETARSRGLDTRHARWLVFLLSSLLVALLVARTGPIAFVGLMAPHFGRMLVGGRHHLLLPAAGLAGALLLVLADAAARLILAPAELPVGVLTSLLGGPFFLFLLLRNAD
jgi:iron complex transport system permease protein